MVRRLGKILLVLTLLCLPQLAPAGCPLMGSMDITCASDSSSIEGCTNAISEDYQDIKSTIAGLQSDPRNPSERLSQIRVTKSGLTSKILLLGSASSYKRKDVLNECDTMRAPTWDIIDRCKSQLISARHGIDLMSRQQIVENLSFEKRERLKLAYTREAAQLEGQLDHIAAFWTGDPSVLCSQSYVSVSACRRAIAMDTDALSRQVFPVYRCGRIVPGQFVDAETAAAEEAQHANDTAPEETVWRMFTPSLSATASIFQNRVDSEKSLLSQAQQTH